MPPCSEFRAAIIDYGMGNLFSVEQACTAAGLPATITSSAEEVRQAAAVILPGVGAFGDAMATLRKLGLVEVIREVVAAGTPVVGICLGMQLLMSESYEFGRHEGLGLIEGTVMPLESQQGAARFKVPHVGWNAITTSRNSWEKTPLQGLPDRTFMYFVHSFYVKPSDSQVVLSTTQYANTEFCSSLSVGNIFACQFHPERSGPYGLRLYQNIARWVQRSSPEVSRV